MVASMKVRDNYNALSGPEKAAVMILALGERRGAEILKRMDEDEIRIVSRAMASLGSITSNLLEDLIKAFTERFAKGGSLVGSYDTTERVLRQFLPGEKVNELISEARGPSGRTTWEKLSSVNEQLLAKYLQQEYPQTIAVVLSKVRPEHAAKVLPLLPEHMVQDVLRRMIRMESVQQDVLQDIEEMLHKELMMNYARTYGADTHEQLAEIFNRTDPEMLDWIFKDLEQDHPEAVQRIKSLMFTFDDVVELDPVSLQQVIRACDTDLLTYALKGANEEVRQIFLSNMSERGGAILRDSIESMGPVLLRDVDAAKDAIVKKAKELAEQGVIIIARGEDAQQAVLY